MTERVRDAVVVGGGPAGSATGLLLARAGRDVVLLERQAFPRSKACGDCISPGANAILGRLGVIESITAARPARLSGWQLSSGSAAFGSGFGGNTRAYALERAVLDEILLDAARAAGVHVITRAHVRGLLRAPDGAVRGVTAIVDGAPIEIAALLTIGADGLRSRMARLLSAHRRAPALRKFSLTAHVRGVPALHDFGEMHVLPGLCLGIAPVQDGADPIANVTVVASANGSRPMPKHDLMRALLTRFRARDLSDLIADTDELLASGPFDWPVDRVNFKGAVLTGDAAGYYDPFTGQGIYQALAGAELVAGLSVAGRLDRYARMHRELTAPARRVQKLVEFVCARPRVADRSFAALARAPELAARLIAVTGDLRPARDLLSPGLLPRLLASLV